MIEQEVRSFPLVPTESLMSQVESAVVNAGLRPAEFMSALTKELRRQPDPRRALNNFQRFLTSGFSVSLLREFRANHTLLQILLDIFSQSQYLADILVRDPELFEWLTSSNALKKAKSREELVDEARATMAPFERLEKKLSALKRFHRREILRIGGREILGEDGIAVITRELSSLADSLIESVVMLGREELRKNNEIQLEPSLAVIGLGKLGGNELNFSSDIDLMFVYERDENLDESPSRIKTSFDYFNRLAEFVVRGLSEHTAEGYLYRVDMRLRPDGTAGALAMSRQAYRAYYETRGETWERQMLLKARVVAGDVEVGRNFLLDVEPFLYPKTTLTSPLNEIAEIKKKVESRLSSSSNIKLGSGGIRDIEFIVQALQLLNGGRNATLRNANTLAVLAALVDGHLLSQKEFRILQGSYELFRTIEHRLQLLHGQQTHSLPVRWEETVKLSRSLGFRSGKEFQKTVETHRREVRKIFESVFAAGESTGLVEDELVERLISKLGVEDIERARKDLETIIRAMPVLYSGEVQRSFVSAVRKYKAAQTALHNLASLSAQKSIGSTLNQGFQNKEIVHLLCLVASRSSRLTQTLSREPVLFESLVARPDEMVKKGLRFEHFLKDSPQKFKTFNEFKACLRFLLKVSTIAQFVSEVSDVAEHLVAHVFHQRVRPEGVCLLALGKFGGREITFGSDIDVICLYRKTRRKSNLEKQLQEFVGFFESQKIYEIDFRLRPEGRSAPLSTHADYFMEYLQQRAEVWEKQALLKLRYVAGDRELARCILLKTSANIYAELPAAWTRHIMKMRQRMEQERSAKLGVGLDLKVAKGGLADIEFGLQAIQLAFGNRNKQLQTPNTFQLLNRLKKMKLLPRADVKVLTKNHEYLRKLETLVRLNSDSKGVILSAAKEELNTLSAAMEESSGAALKKRVNTVRGQNRRFLLKAVKLCKS